MLESGPLMALLIFVFIQCHCVQMNVWQRFIGAVLAWCSDESFGLDNQFEAVIILSTPSFGLTVPTTITWTLSYVHRGHFDHFSFCAGRMWCFQSDALLQSCLCSKNSLCSDLMSSFSTFMGFVSVCTHGSCCTDDKSTTGWRWDNSILICGNVSGRF